MKASDMRLINTTTFEFEEKNEADVNRKYAILSHRWTDDEVEYGPYLKLDKSIMQQKTSPGEDSSSLGKIWWACSIAREQNLSYLWVDTCCINKGEIPELDRSIRSMFSWYERAAVCYAYLATATESNERKPKEWFTRGWPLQELLAPREMEFFNAQWVHIGSRSELRKQIQKAANITPEYLDNFRSASVATKLSWAAGRITTREEDRVYSMLGLLGVGLDIRYGEGGEAAFLRFQEQIIQRNHDETIFAWTCKELESSGMLAPSIDCFRDSGDITYNPDHRARGEFRLTNRGLEFPAPLWTVGGSQGEDIGFKLRGLKKEVDLVLYAWRWDKDNKKQQHVSIRLKRGKPSYRVTNLEFQRINCGVLGYAKKVPRTISGSVNGIQSLGATSLINIPQTAVYKSGSKPVEVADPQLYRAKLGRGA